MIDYITTDSSITDFCMGWFVVLAVFRDIRELREHVPARNSYMIKSSIPIVDSRISCHRFRACKCAVSIVGLISLSSY